MTQEIPEPARSSLALGMLFLVAAGVLIPLGIVNSPGALVVGAFALLLAVVFLADYALDIRKHREWRTQAIEARLDATEGKLGRMHERLEGVEHRLAEARSEIRSVGKSAGPR
jgi:hypothetical protein